MARVAILTMTPDPGQLVRQTLSSGVSFFFFLLLSLFYSSPLQVWEGKKPGPSIVKRSAHPPIRWCRSISQCRVCGTMCGLIHVATGRWFALVVVYLKMETFGEMSPRVDTQYMCCSDLSSLGG